MLDRAGITLNKNTVPTTRARPFVDERPAHRHAGGDDAGHDASPRWRTIAELIDRALRGRTDDAELAAVRDDVETLCSKFAPTPDLRRRTGGQRRSVTVRRGRRGRLGIVFSMMSRSVTSDQLST